MTGSLLVSMSSILDKTRDAADATLEKLTAEGVPVALLIAPHIDGNWHLSKDKETLAWIKEKISKDSVLILNGFDQAVQGRRAEFASLESYEARLRLLGATRHMAALGLETDMFAPPRWRLSPGTLEVASEFGFQLVGSTKGIYHASEEGWVLSPGRNLSVGEGFGAPGWWRRSIIQAARRGAEKGNTVRLSASARNLREKKVREDFIRAVLAARDAGAQPDTHRFIPH